MTNKVLSESDVQPYDRELIESLQSEVDFYKKNHRVLREEVQAVAQANKELNSLLQDNLGSTSLEQISAHKTTSDQVIDNLRTQIELLNEEKLTLHGLWKTAQHTIENLEFEIKEYIQQFKDTRSVTEVKKVYLGAIQKLEAKIISLQDEIKGAKELNMSLENSRKICEQKLLDLDKKHNDLTAEHNQLLEQVKRTEQVIKNSKTEIASIMREREHMEQKVALSLSAQKEYRIRESIAYNKIQEALSIVEVAIAEKNAALLRENEIRDERDQLALNISQAMEEASNKVDCNVEEIKTKYSDKIKTLKKIIAEVNTTSDAQVKKINELEYQAKAMEIKLNEVLKSNDVLDSELQIASKTIIELEIKLQAYEKLMAREQEISQVAEQQSLHLKEFYDSNKKIKQRWKETFDEMTEQLQKELKQFQRENSALKQENLKLRSALMQFETSKNKSTEHKPKPKQ